MRPNYTLWSSLPGSMMDHIQAQRTPVFIQFQCFLFLVITLFCCPASQINKKNCNEFEFVSLFYLKRKTFVVQRLYYICLSSTIEENSWRHYIILHCILFLNVLHYTTLRYTKPPFLSLQGKTSVKRLLRVW